MARPNLCCCGRILGQPVDLEGLRQRVQADTVNESDLYYSGEQNRLRGRSSVCMER